MITLLENRGLIKVSGADSQAFLQSQFSNDISLIKDKEVLINGYCQHQGKIIAILWVFIKNNNFYLSLPYDLKELVLSRLNMFKLMSDVTFEDFSSVINQYGLIDEKDNESCVIKNNLSILTSREMLEAKGDLNHWEKACIGNNLPEIYIDTSEQFIPQALNLDINEIGVSFTKGCYPGQEVVARMHYLGKPKRRLFRFTSKFEVYIGDNLNVKDSKSLKSSGKVIRVAKNDTEFEFLGVFEVGHIDDKIFLNSDQTKLVNLIHE